MIWQDGPVTVHIGDALGVLRDLPAESVHCVVTSPPYWGLRDYGTAEWEGGDPICEHSSSRRNYAEADKQATQGGSSRDPIRSDCRHCGAHRIDSQLGLEATPEEYIARMVEVFREVRRVLRKDGTLWLNMGDSYASNGTSHAGDGMAALGAQYRGGGHKAAATEKPSRNLAGLKQKDLVGIPWRLAFALQADGWWLRSDIIWSKPNPMPESVTDRPTKAHEYVFLLTKSARYFYDAEAVREPNLPYAIPNGKARRDVTERTLEGPYADQPILRRGRAARAEAYNPVGRNLRSVWTIATQPYPEAHFATFPEELARRCIAAGTSERGCCPQCGAPWVRVVETEYVKSPVHGNGSVVGRHYATGQNNFDGAGMPRVNKQVSTTGWLQPCFSLKQENRGCIQNLEPVSCTVLDPFAGSGTTLAVARRMGRRAVGIELQADYLPLIQRRVSEAALPLLEMLEDAQATQAPDPTLV